MKPLREPKPAGVITTTAPDAPLPTVAVIAVSETTVKAVAAVSPKLTLVVPVKLLPMIVTMVPTDPVAGVKERMTGSCAPWSLNTVTVASALFEVARSGLPSPSRSAIAIY